ncbi:MAG: hypothetical protein C5B53_08595, partial [Candidatus Melainabacteria bacterium]
MVIQEPSSRNIWEERIADLRRYDLDLLEAQPLDPKDITSWGIPTLTFARIDGVLRSWDIEREKQQQNQNQPQQGQDPNQVPKRMYLMEDALAGLHSQQARVAFLVLGNKTGVNYYFGASLDSGSEEGNGSDSSSTMSFNAVRSVLNSVYNGVEIHNEPFTGDTMKSMIAARANYVGVITGIPALKSTGGDTFDSEQIERLAKGLRGYDFGFLVLAVPVPKDKVMAEEFNVVDQIQRAQENEDPEKKKRIKYYLELQDAYLKHLQLGMAVGNWMVGAYFFAPDRSVFARLQSLLQGTYVDETCRPTPLRTHPMKGLRPHVEQFGLLSNRRSEGLLGYKFLAPLNSRLLSAFIHLPKQEMPGFRIKRSAEFSLADIPPKDPTRVIAVGNILDRGVDTGNLYNVDIDALQKHTIVCGVTGGGKTNTCFYLLGQLWKFGIPFMVIEPAKSEYRHMMLMSETFKGVGQSFSLGDETVSPFRLNPFEIMKGVKVQTHLDALKSVFNASFEMYAPMPQVLEKALNS